MEEISAVAASAFDPDTYQSSGDVEHRMSFGMPPRWRQEVYEWDITSTCIQEPPYFRKFQ